ncbi:MAG: PepSY domain-containing protein [Pedobacter sp.]|nr:MAG: PepSY domain-containing protein [Pedobacter sp.]
MLKPLKKLNAWLHLWLGLASGIIVVILGITGCILVFEQEIRSLSSPWLHVEKPAKGTYLPPSALYKEVKKALPEKEIRSVWYHGANRTAHFSINDSDSMIYVNPYTAQIVAMVDHEDFFHEIDEGHRHLWLPENIGRPIVGWATFIFFILLITGLILWWPKNLKKSNVDKSFKVKWKAKFKRVNYDLHNVFGFYSLLLALLMAVTGLIMSFSWFNNSMYWLTGGDTNKPKQKEEIFEPSKLPMLGQVDKIWRKVQDEIAVDNKDQIIVSFPDHGDDPIYVCTDMVNGHWRDLYFNQADLFFTNSTGKRMGDLPFADKVRKLNYTLHVGAFAGLFSKTIYFLASLICASLPITGFYIWWGKKKKSKKKIPKPKLA